MPVRMCHGARYVERRFGDIEVSRNRKQSNFPPPVRAPFLHLIAEHFEVIVADEEVHHAGKAGMRTNKEQTCRLALPVRVSRRIRLHQAPSCALLREWTTRITMAGRRASRRDCGSLRNFNLARAQSVALALCSRCSWLRCATMD